MAVLKTSRFFTEIGMKDRVGRSLAASSGLTNVRLGFPVAFFLFAALLIGLNLSAPAQDTVSGEYKLKAVYLYNFVQYVEWPPTAFASERSPLIIGVLGADPFGKILDETVAGEIVKNRPLEVRRYKKVQEINECHVLFISASEKDRLKSILASLKERSILTVGDLEGFSAKGGIVRFITEKNKIRFGINLEAAKAANLSVSSKLLQLAEIVPTQSSK